MTIKAKISVGIAAAVVVAALFTVLNKRWWALRTMRKWDIQSNLADNKELLKNTSLARMMEIYRKGMDGWTLRTTVGGTSVRAEGVDLAEEPEFTG